MSGVYICSFSSFCSKAPRREEWPTCSAEPSCGVAGLRHGRMCGPEASTRWFFLVFLWCFTLILCFGKTFVNPVLREFRSCYTHVPLFVSQTISIDFLNNLHIISQSIRKIISLSYIYKSSLFSFDMFFAKHFSPAKNP